METVGETQPRPFGSGVRANPPQELLDALSYDPITGEFRWLITRSRAEAGSVAGTLSSSGYMQVQFGGRRYMLHRVAWMKVHGELPSGLIDHANGVRSDNRIENLREATNGQNQANRRPAERDLPKGVKRTHVGTFSATIMKDGVSEYLGTFKCEHQAATAYQRAALEKHGEFARW